MTQRLLLAAALLALAACKADKPVWKAHDAGPLSLEFPCEPATAAAVTKCMRPDGAEYAVAVVEKGIPAAEELAQISDYAKAIPKGEVLDVGQFPVKWREIRQYGTLEAAVYYLDGKEFTVSVAYSSNQAPPQLAEFFSKVKTK
jgi:hypothetical protein